MRWSFELLAESLPRLSEGVIKKGKNYKKIKTYTFKHTLAVIRLR